MVRLTVREGALVIDAERRLGGRGAYLCPQASCATAARKRGALPRRLRTPVEVPDDLEQRVAG
jgi:predicted RNA-binding protein YlxR (DUF448 family)